MKISSKIYVRIKNIYRSKTYLENISVAKKSQTAVVWYIQICAPI